MSATARHGNLGSDPSPPSRGASEPADPFAELLEPDHPTASTAGGPADDPFDELDGSLDAEDTLAASRDDLGPVRDLFGTRPHLRPAPARADPRRAVGGSGWPAHNYNDAYRTLRAETQRRGVGRRRSAERAPHELWEVDELVPDAATTDDQRIRAALADAPPHAAPPPASRYPGIPVTRPWPASHDRDPTRDADEWLDGLAAARPARATVAQLVAGVPLHRTPAAVVDVSETLFARARGPRHPVGTMRDVPAAQDPPTLSGRALRITTTIAVTLFALALLQLIVLSL